MLAELLARRLLRRPEYSKGGFGAFQNAHTMADYPVAKVTDIAPGRTLRVVVDGTEILLCNCEGAIYAIEDVCTHDGAPLDQGELEECRIVCARHGAEFRRAHRRSADTSGRNAAANFFGTHPG